MKVKKLLGKNIKEKRVMLGLTQEELSEKIGISPRTLSQIELGNNFVSAENLEAICEALNVQPKVLFDFNEIDEKTVLENVTAKLSSNKKLLDKIYRILSIIE